MLKIREAIVVEGKYDKNTLSQIVDAPVFQTNGFGIRKDKDLIHLLRAVARERGLIVFTDSDGGGLLIRNFLKSAIEPQYLKHAYIPQIPGKERRKTASGKEGLLGVEGMNPQMITDCLLRCGATVEGECPSHSGQITKQDLVELGLSGGANSSVMRKELMKKLNFPENMSANALLQAMNVLYSREAFFAMFGEKDD